jgi:Pyridoxamine 5'-phosphate oxidase
MTDAHAYTPSHFARATELPPEVARYLDGADLIAKTQAVRLSTVDETGWPRAALLSAGDALALPGGAVRFLIFKDSATARNLLRDGRLVVTLALDGGMIELQCHVLPLAEASAADNLTAFEAKLETARLHKAPYADVTSGITFALHDPAAVEARWRRQIAALRAAK